MATVNKARNLPENSATTKVTTQCFKEASTMQTGASLQAVLLYCAPSEATQLSNLLQKNARTDGTRPC
jgi:hypothetical protein